MVLVDAYNVLHVTGILPPDLAGIDLPELARLIAGSRYAGREVRLLCDGAARGGGLPATPGVSVAYAGPGVEADDLIEQILRKTSRARETLVVSSDRRIRRAARSRGASVLASEQFLKHLAADRDRPRPLPLPAFATNIPLDPYSVGVWAREFGYPAPSPPSPLPPPPIPRPSSPPRQPAGAQGVSLAAAAGTPVPLPPPTPSAPRPEEEPRVGGVSPQEAWLAEALKEWPGRLSVDDLDMRRWLAPPYSPPPPSP